MKIIVDENITYGEEAFSLFGEVFLHPGREITNEIVKDADVLIVRSITNVNEDLLKDSKVKFVGTATIGFDHIDTEYLKEKDIYFTTAIGCNSYAVAEYVMSSLAYFIKNKNFSIMYKSIGIIGLGNIGSIIEKYANCLGLKTVLNDPPLKRKTNDPKYRSLEEALNCDIVTLHVPLNKTGIDKTLHLINEESLKLLKPGTILINSCRGPVIDNQALKSRLKTYQDIYTVLDVWENEPYADLELLKLVDLATAHIAGYSYEGKVNGTKIISDKLAWFLNENMTWNAKKLVVSNPMIKLDSPDIDTLLTNLFEHIYDINFDSEQLKSYSNDNIDDFVRNFDLIRKNYPFRRELSNFFVNQFLDDEKLKTIVEVFRLKIQ